MKKIEIESKKFKEDETFIVNHFDEFGKDKDMECKSLEEAVTMLAMYQTAYEESGFNNCMASPSLCHPDGSGREWSLESSEWI